MTKKRINDITVRMRRKDGTKATGDQAKKALWAAHKIAQRGGDVEAEMRDWEISAIDWRKVTRAGRKREFHYVPGGRASITQVVADMGGILETLGLAGLRVAVPD
jgi:hypothetical protein